jgi:hypothetical protein
MVALAGKIGLMLDPNIGINAQPQNHIIVNLAGLTQQY